MAEFLIKAQQVNWMDDTSKWAAKGVTQEKYDARGVIGDIVEVRKDGSLYGKLECLPWYVIIKVPSIDYAVAKRVLEKALYETRIVDTVETQVLRKKRLYRVTSQLVNDAIAAGGILTLTRNQAIGYIRKRSLNVSQAIIENTITIQEFQ